MLRRLNVRMRLIAVLLVPFVLLLAVAGPEVIERRAAARGADRAADLTAASADVTAVLDQIESERTRSAATRSGAGDEIRAQLQEQRAATDEAVDRARRSLDRIAATEPRLTDAVREVSSALDDLADVRTATDLAQSIVPWVDPFQDVLTALLDLQEGMGSAIDAAGTHEAITQLALLGRAKEAAAAQSAQLAAAAVWGELRGDQVGILARLRADEQAYRTAHLAATPSDDRVARRAAISAGAATTAGRVVDAVVREASVDAVGGLGPWLSLSAARQQVARSVELAGTEIALADARAAGADARRASTVYLGLAGAGLLLGLLLALAAARSITRPLRQLTTAADHLATERLPKLVDALRNPGDDDERFLAATVQPIAVGSDDELGQLARAFNSVQSVAVDVAAEQADLLRKGISDLYVNLARRNQSLLERQIRLLDRIEHEDQEPELLDDLYELDHLATRMRRNAESLLVLAGAEPDRRRSRPVPAVDVVRAAVSEVEQYARIELGSLADGVLAGPAVSDVAHIVAELLDNATNFSAPTTTVRIDGRRAGSGYQIVITDSGVGMPAPQLAELNRMLRQPPVTGLALGRALGCLVAARLAARHAIDIRLEAGVDEGIVATVALPRHLLQADAPAVDTAPAAASEPVVEPAPVDDPWLYEWGEAAGPITIGSPPPSPSTLREAIPASEEITAGLEAILDGREPPTWIEPAVGDAPGPASDASVTASGLVRRVPRASGVVEPSTATEPRVRRSPDEVRTMLSRYRSGLRAGRGTSNPPSEE